MSGNTRTIEATNSDSGMVTLVGVIRFFNHAFYLETADGWYMISFDYVDAMNLTCECDGLNAEAVQNGVSIGTGQMVGWIKRGSLVIV